MPTKDELEKENAELKAQLEALQPGNTGENNVCVLCGTGITDRRYYIRHPEHPDGPPVDACYDCFDSQVQAGHWAQHGEESEMHAGNPPDPEEGGTPGTGAKMPEHITEYRYVPSWSTGPTRTARTATPWAPSPAW